MQINETELERFLNDLGLASTKELGSEDRRRVEAYLLGIPFVDLKNHRFDFPTLCLIPEPVARHHNVVALRKTESGLEVAILETEGLSAIEFVRENTGLKILPRLTDEESMKHALLSYQEMLKAEFGDIIQKETSALNGIAIVDALLRHALLQGASAIHIEPQESEVLVRYRLSGRLFDAMVLPTRSALPILVRTKSLSGLKIEESELLQEGFFNVERGVEKVSFRVSIVPTLHGEKITLHPLRRNAKGFTLEALGFKSEDVEEMHKVLSLRRGLILVVGREGSGKTTTLYTLLDILNSPQLNIATIEHSIEYRLPRVNQCLVREDLGLDLAQSLRMLLRQDPDVIMVSELDAEAAKLVLNVADRGLLMLAGMTAQSREEALDRLRSWGLSLPRQTLVVDQRQKSPALWIAAE